MASPTRPVAVTFLIEVGWLAERPPSKLQPVCRILLITGKLMSGGAITLVPVLYLIRYT